VVQPGQPDNLDLHVLSSRTGNQHRLLNVELIKEPYIHISSHSRRLSNVSPHVGFTADRGHAAASQRMTRWARTGREQLRKSPVPIPRPGTALTNGWRLVLAPCTVLCTGKLLSLFESCP